MPSLRVYDLSDMIYLMPLVTPSTIPSLSSRVLSRILIPVPPIEVQEKIVSVLDHFLALNDELAKIQDYKGEQKEYYMEKLLNFGN